MVLLRRPCHGLGAEGLKQEWVRCRRDWMGKAEKGTECRSRTITIKSQRSRSLTQGERLAGTRPDQHPPVREAEGKANFCWDKSAIATRWNRQNNPSQGFQLSIVPEAPSLEQGHILGMASRCTVQANVELRLQDILKYPRIGLGQPGMNTVNNPNMLVGCWLTYNSSYYLLTPPLFNPSCDLLIIHVLWMEKIRYCNLLEVNWI